MKQLLLLLAICAAGYTCATAQTTNNAVNAQEQMNLNRQSPARKSNQAQLPNTPAHKRSDTPAG